MYKTSRLYFLFLPILMLSFYAQGKAVLLNENSGLNNTEVTCITKDKSGLMWVGTRRGLSKYDGYRFYPVEFFKKQTINTLLYDSLRDVLWIGTNAGLFYMYIKERQVITCLASSSEQSVTCLKQYENQIYVGFNSKYILRINQDFSCKVVYRFGTSQLAPNQLIVDSSGDVYCVLQPDDRVVKISQSQGTSHILSEKSTRSIDVFSIISEQVYAGSYIKGFWNVPERTYSTWYFDTLNSIRHDPEVLLQHKNSLLIAYRNPTSLYEVNLDNHSIKDLTDSDPGIFTYKRIYCLYKDEFDVVWIGTSKGLIKLPADKPKIAFEKILPYSDKPISARQMIEIPNGDFYIGTYSGFFVREHGSKSWTNLNKQNYKGKPVDFSQRSLLLASDRHLYIGSDANYFWRLDRSSQQFELLWFGAPNGSCNTKGAVLSMIQDADSLLWLGTENGLVSYHPQTKQFTCHFDDKYSVKGSAVRYLYKLSSGRRFWAGTENGLFLIDVDSGRINQLDENSVPALSDEYINVVTEDQSGNIWIGTSVGGINVLSADYTAVYNITKKDGLSSNEVYHMLWQDSANLWISTYNGLNHYHIPSQTITPYYESDGIANNEFNQNSAYKDATGKLYFGGVNGVTAFYPPRLTLLSKPFEIFVSDITKWDRKTETYKQVSADETNRITIEPGDNLLTFSFAGTDFTAPELTSYYYKIDGLHANWISLGAQPVLRLESLKGGEHRLLVKAIKGSRGEASLNTLVYDIKVGQEFYQTVWFYVLLALLLALMVYLYFLNRLNTQKKLELLRVRIASNLHDEVGSLLTRITMSADRLVTRMPRDSETRDKLEGVSELSRAANAAMSDVLWTIDARNDVTGSLTDRMREHAEDLLLPKGIEAHIHFTDVDPQEKLSPEFRQNLFLVYKELINNIIKHSQAAEVTIVYKQQKDGFMLSVKNDGVTVSDGPSGTGLGLRNIQMRAAVLKAKAIVKQEQDTFEVVLYT